MSHKVSETELKRYLLAAAKHGYADKANERRWAKEDDHSTTIRHSEGSWSLDDNFFGGEPYGGREVVFFEGRPVWMMVYYGMVSLAVTDVRGVYSCLQDALAEPPPELPVRGPRTFTRGRLRYEASWEGGLFRFTGSERIRDADVEIYSASFTGGLVDARNESAN